MATCNLCAQHPPDAHILDHLRILHPDTFTGILRWPDGRIAIVDLTLQPSDFQPPGQPDTEED